MQQTQKKAQSPLMHLSETQLRTMSRSLLRWYEANARSLPWRPLPAKASDFQEDDFAYRVLVSETMLQQTQCERVVSYFNRWISQWPSLSDLALYATEDDVIKLWAGLGYYNRCKRLLRLAQLVYHHMDAQLPRSREDLLKLEGIGDYTASAVASIAFKQQVGAVDANVVRVLSRVSNSPVSKAAGAKSYQQLADQLAQASDGRAGDLNQAMMELGATVCTSRAPKCTSHCPLNKICGAYNADDVDVEDLPPKPPKPARKTQSRAARVIRAYLQQQYNEAVTSKHSYVLLCKRPSGAGLLAGSWEFPAVEIDNAAASDGDLSTLFAGIDSLLEHEGITIQNAPFSRTRQAYAGRVEHTFSHIQQSTDVQVVDGARISHLHNEGAEACSGFPVPMRRGDRLEAACWVPEEEVSNFGLSSAPLKIWRKAQHALDGGSDITKRKRAGAQATEWKSEQSSKSRTGNRASKRIDTFFGKGSR